MHGLILTVFGFVYLGMILGDFPGLMLDRTGIALVGAIVLIAGGAVSPTEAWGSIDVPTMGLLFGLMVVSAQFRLGGFYNSFTYRLSKLQVSPTTLLALVIASTGALSALLCNDIICLAMAPVLAEGCARRQLDPVPYLLALACASNVGSAATLIGNPQNMLIGQVLQLHFGQYLIDAGPPTVLGLAVVWAVIAVVHRGRWHKHTYLRDYEMRPFNAWQTGKGTLVLAALVLAFLVSPWPREVLALAAGGLLLTSRRLASATMLQLVDWQLLVLFAGLFIVNHALQSSGNLEWLMGGLRHAGIEPAHPGWLFVLSVGLSNVVSNVPATILLLPSAKHELAGPILALSSTLAGNLFVVGSIANLIVIDQAARLSIRIGWREHARIGIPVTVITLALAAGWLCVLTQF